MRNKKCLIGCEASFNEKGKLYIFKNALVHSLGGTKTGWMVVRADRKYLYITQDVLMVSRVEIKNCRII